MFRREFLRSLLVFAGVVPQAFVDRAIVPPRTVLLQTSPVAGFQYHEGETAWASLHEGLAVDLVREAGNIHDEKAVRIDWARRKLGYLPRAENHAAAQLLNRGEQLEARIAGLRESRNPWERVRVEVSLVV